ncbi:MAG: ABC transporter ATP-binding protein/permease [Clostridiales bacterium]|nr:ABC transporter ATP-binding protein/permease [Clostridiales bacterium]
MLQLKNITKDYAVNSELTVQALKGISVDFRTNEFVSILGPSGCGKTTLLNIIGGLDQYTEGDLVIDGVSTKDYKDRDWDTYRNHSIGFVFQTYNLIPHQTVLKNVELALTLAGVSKAERRKRAEEALARVGLGDQLHKRPNQMSGGQMQRVAIARALVNNPDIVLADEPTGALDTETGVQVMEILKEVAKDRLVIMVTHNPELAEKYSTRIIRVLDGKIVDDSSPLTETEFKAEKAAEDSKAQEKSVAKADKKRDKQKKRSSMSFWTAFKLSLNNLFTKKGRTVLTSFAGSIGIIGIALILSVSQGMTAYINLVQEQTLTTYPLSIESTAMDLSQLVADMMGIHDGQAAHDDGKVYNRSTIYNVAKTVANTTQSASKNDLNAFKKFLEDEVADETSKLHDAIAGLQYQYDIDMTVYTKNVDGNIMGSDVNALLNAVISKLLGANAEMQMGGYYGSMATFSMNVWQELLPGNDGSYVNKLLYDQYDLVTGKWPNAYNEIVLVLSDNNEISDISLYALGLLGEEYVQQIANSFDADSEEYENVDRSWTYEELMAREYVVILDSSCYYQNGDVWEDWRDIEGGLNKLYNEGLKLKISGIVRPNPDATATMLSGAIGYTAALFDEVVRRAENSDALKAQLANKDTDIFTGLPFKTDTSSWSEKDKADAYREYFQGLNDSAKIEQYLAVYAADITPLQELKASQTVDGMTTEQLRGMAAMMLQQSMPADRVEQILSSLTDDEIRDMAKEAFTSQYVQQAVATEQKRLNSLDDPIEYVDNYIDVKNDAQLAKLYDTTKNDESDSTYERNLLKLGYVDLDTPSVINIYASSFDAKDVIAAEIARYNESVEEEQQIRYTDFVALIMSAVTTIIDAVTYVLIAFVSISLVVSSIMIGVITLISVQERTKEIGILRAIGASKRDVSSMFNAETVIIGFAAGVFGVLFTYLLCIPINLILHLLTGIATLNAYLPPVAALILILISVALTLVSGLIPSRSAAKKDPVTALRTE